MSTQAAKQPDVARRRLLRKDSLEHMVSDGWSTRMRRTERAQRRRADAEEVAAGRAQESQT